MSDILSAPAIYLIWLIGFALALGVAGIGVWCFAVRKGRVSARVWVLWSAAALLPICLSFWDVLHRYDPGFVGTFVLVLETLLLAGVAIGFFVAGGRQQKAAAGQQRSAAKTVPPAGTRRLSWALVGLNVVAAAWASHRLYECAALEDAAYLATLSSWLPEPTRDVRAETDQGEALTLYAPVANPAAIVPNREALAAADARRYADRRIKRRDASPPSNCHGWVFTGGRFFLGPDDVEKILSGNAYRTVSRPKAGDLVIYRDAAGSIVHSGIVRLVDQELVLVESQWGTSARYLHEPVQQAYSTSFEYYRTPRGGHRIRLIDEPGDEL